MLLESDHPSLLVTWGLAQPKVILPATAGAWSDERARVVLTHELAHIRRGDWIVQLVGRAAARVLLVQSAALDRLPAAPSRKRACVR